MAPRDMANEDRVYEEVPSLSMDNVSILRMRKQYGLRRSCVCGWGPLCRIAQIVYVWNERVNNVKDVRSGDCKVLKLHSAPATERSEIWKHAILTNTNNRRTPKNLYAVPVALHHWTPRQIEYFKNNPSTGAEFSVWKDLVHTPDDRFRYTVHVNKSTKKTLYFHIPNVDGHFIHDEVQAILDRYGGGGGAILTAQPNMLNQKKRKRPMYQLYPPLKTRNHVASSLDERKASLKEYYGKRDLNEQEKNTLEASITLCSIRKSTSTLVYR